MARRGARVWLGTYGRGLLYLIPALVVFGLFQWYPIVQNFFLAFQHYVPGFEKSWVGLRNFASVLGDTRLPQAAVNTLQYVGLCLLLGFVVPIVAAIAIMEIRRARGFFRLAIYIPNIIPGIALYVIWRYVFNPRSGLLNAVLGLLGIEPQPWLLAPNQVMLSLVIMSTWTNFGGTAVLYMASLTRCLPSSTKPPSWKAPVSFAACGT